MTDTTNATQDSPVLTRKPYEGIYRAHLDDPDTDGTTATSNQDPANAAIPDKNPENPQEKVFKDRYDNLKRHHDKTIVELRKEVTSLKTQLNNATAQKWELPKSLDEVKAWAESNPDAYALVRTISAMTANERAQELETKINEVDQRAIEVTRDKTVLAIRKAHPDFDDLCNSEDLHNWLAEQPSQVQSWLYDNFDNADLAIKAIQLYKVERGIGKSNEPAQPPARTRDEIAREAAQAVGNTRSVNEPTGQNKKIWKSSDIKKLKPKEYDALESEIDLAAREGRVVDDLRKTL